MMTAALTRTSLVKQWARGGRGLAVVFLVWLLVAAPLPWPVTPVFGATFTVDRTDDNASATACTLAANDCSLRGAIIKANSSPGADTIVLQSGATYTLSLDADGGGHAIDSGANNDDLDITSQITIEGNGATIERSTAVTCNLNGTVQTGEFRIFDVRGGGNLTLQDLTVRNGCADGGFPDNYGGGIFVASGPPAAGQLTLTNVTLTQDRAYSNGGGIASGGTVTITGSTLSGNSAGTGGGINNLYMLTIANSTLCGNSAAFSGGGIANGGMLTITGSTLSGNSAGNDGGGIYNVGMLTITGSTLSGNKADADNSGGGDGGGIWTSGANTVNASFVTIAGNSTGSTGAGGGIRQRDGTFNIENSIVGHNTAPTGPNCWITGGTFIPTGTNLATDRSCGEAFSRCLPPGQED